MKTVSAIKPPCIFLAPMKMTNYISSPTGRAGVRPIGDANGAITSYTLDYFVKDHLGNVRMVLTEILLQNIYPADTFEGSTANANDAIAIENQ